jgi:transcription elongation GreA/GreB family factor
LGDADIDPVVAVGSRVRIRGAGVGEQEIAIVEADDEGLYRLSTRTPLARALIGRRQGDEVKVETDAGIATFLIVTVDP